MGIVIDGVRMGGSIADVTMRTGAVANRCVDGDDFVGDDFVLPAESAVEGAGKPLPLRKDLTR